MIGDISQLNALQNKLLDVQNMMKEVQELYVKIMSVKNPNEIKELQGQLELALKKLDDFKKSIDAL